MVCDGVVIINRGRVVAQGAQAQLVEQVFPTARIEIEIGGPREAVEAALRGIAGVLRRAGSLQGGRHADASWWSRLGGATFGAGGAAGERARVAAARAPSGGHEPGRGLHQGGGGRKSAARSRSHRRRGPARVAGGRTRLMRWLPVFKKEMRLYFGSPVAYAFLAPVPPGDGLDVRARSSSSTASSPCACVHAADGGAEPQSHREASARPLFSNMSVVLLFFMPMLTMRALRRGEEVGHHRAAADLSRA